MFSNAFNDHLALTMAALGDQYQIAAEIQNLTLAPPVLPLPGIPLFLSPAAPPVFVQVIDRDIILARADVVTTPVEFNCLRTSKDGCNYNAVAPIGVPTAYQQLANGTLINGAALPFGLTDVWNLRPGKPKGFTCCELADLSNAPSLHDERIDVVFAFPAPPGKVKANVLDAKVDDKTLSGLWPSDHASVSAELTY